MWSASGLAGPWRDAALAGGPGGGRADRDLDAVLGLFDAAARFVDRLPGASPADFLDHVLGQDVAGDTLVARAPAGESVALVTPAASAGLEWDLVVVAGVQEGVWPDLRLRGSLLGSTDLVDLVTGRGGDPRAARAQVRHDETRLFHVAVTRARHRLVVTAIRSEDEQPSPFLDVVDPLPDARAFTDVPRPLTLQGLVADLRRALGSDDPALRGAAVSTLGRLAREGVPGADPAQWWTLRDLTDDRPRRGPADPVRVSPSGIDGFWRCGLQWVLRASGGDGPSMGAQDVGILVHEIAHDLGDTTAAAYAAEVERRWGRLGLAPGWLSRRRLAEAQRMTGRLATYVAETTAQGWRRAASEQQLKVALGRAVVSGTVDRVEVDPAGRVRVIDLKTGTTKPSKEELRRHGQLGAYQLAVAEGAFAEHGSVPAGAALLQLGKAANLSTTVQLQVPLADDEEPGWARALLDQTADAMSGAGFAATPGSHCGTCQVKDACPAQSEGRFL
jgi:RecB family exonuclease